MKPEYDYTKLAIPVVIMIALAAMIVILSLPPPAEPIEPPEPVDKPARDLSGLMYQDRAETIPEEYLVADYDAYSSAGFDTEVLYRPPGEWTFYCKPSGAEAEIVDYYSFSPPPEPPVAGGWYSRGAIICSDTYWVLDSDQSFGSKLYGPFKIGESVSVPGELPASEIRDYEGERLSSIDDFRENSIKGPQYIDIDSYRLEVTGLVDSPLSLTYDEVLAYDAYQKVVTLYCVEGWDVKLLWEGVLISDLLADAGVQAGANTVILHAYDGYTTSFPLGYLTDNPILLAYKMNEVALPPERGFPFQLVAESKWGYKWIKWVTKIELSDDASYEGFWESRGYSNTADLDEGFYA